MLFAGVSAANTPALGGTLSFRMDGTLSWATWAYGSAKNTIFNTRLNISRYWRDLNNGFYFNKISSL